MAFVTTKNQSEFYPEKDVTRKTADGREIVVARKGTPLPMEKAISLGLVRPETEKPAKKKAEKPTENKKVEPTENKGKDDAK